MDPILVQTLLFAAFATLASASGATKIYINQVSAYSSLAQCAEPEVSTIVRDMSYGCGDGSRTTSYACFCYQSSSEFSSMIENHVSTACSADSSQATLAVQVFSDYCQLGEIAAIQTNAPKSTSATPSPSLSQPKSTSMSSSLASPASSSTTVFVTTDPASTSASSTTPISSSSTTPSSSPKTSSPAAAIAAGVTVPIFVIAFAIAGFFLWRRRSRAKRSGIELADGDQGLNTIEVYPKRPLVAYELKEESIVEIGESVRRVEPIDLTKGVQRHELEVRQ